MKPYTLELEVLVPHQCGVNGVWDISTTGISNCFMTVTNSCILDPGSEQRHLAWLYH